VSRQVLDVLVRLVDDLGQLLAVDHLLVDVHRHSLVQMRVLLHIVADDFGNGRTPAKQIQLHELIFACGLISICVCVLHSKWGGCIGQKWNVKRVGKFGS
jgi:hypothetical protein